jgi:nucleoside-diphosphate kinase
MTTEKTLVLVKPDGVERNLTGEIIARFEKAGLVISALKMMKVSRELISKHYPAEDEYLISLGKKSEKAGDVVPDYKKQGLMIVEGLRLYLTSGPVVAMVVKGENAIQRVRSIAGYTDPSAAEKGTIRGDFGQDSILKANKEKRSVKNLVHASGNREEAEKEIALWFQNSEILK